MNSNRHVHVVGTGTIGEPLITFFGRNRDALGLDLVTFRKNTPLPENLPEVNEMQKAGAKLVVDREMIGRFEEAGYKVHGAAEDARANAMVIIDCTPDGRGRENKAKFYDALVQAGSLRRCILQGSEKGGGIPYASGINDSVITPDTTEVQTVSCNSHFLLYSTLAACGGDFSIVEEVDDVLFRRAADVSQTKKHRLDVRVDPHGDPKHGTHQASDMARVLETIGVTIPFVFSSTAVSPTLLMHNTRFSVLLRGSFDTAAILKMIARTEGISRTSKLETCLVFSFGRDFSPNGRIFNPAIIAMPTIMAIPRGKLTKVVGWGDTSQDGNSLRSSIIAALSAIYPEDWKRFLPLLAPYMFAEV